MSNLDFWNSRYAEADGHLFGEAPNAFLARNAGRLQPGWQALAVADGDGRNGVFLAEKGLRVRSSDFSPVAQEKARRLAAARGVTVNFELADLSRYAWPREAYDVVVAIFFQFLAPAARTVAFRGIVETLRPGGTFLGKAFRGGTEQDLLQSLKREFDKVAHVKPPASRPESPELFVLATGFRGRDDDASRD